MNDLQCLYNARPKLAHILDLVLFGDYHVPVVLYRTASLK
jgi:hypothetical protein